MFAQHKKKIIGTVAAAFLAVLAVFYEVVVAVVTDNLLTTDAVTTETTE